MTIVPGTKLGPYEVTEQVGRGGMATIFKAYQAGLARNVAVKVLPAFFAEEPGFRERFQQEAIAVAKLRHPNILQVFDYGEVDGLTYLVSEFIDGGTLADQIGRPLRPDYVVRTLSPIASALDYAHSREVLHRDVKPSNVLLQRDGTPVLADFGLAKMAGSLQRLTATGIAVGTPEYMAPEQGSATNVGPAADQYSLAVVAYEMLTGRVPFSAETPVAVMVAHIQKPLIPPRSINPEISEGVEAALLRALAKDPAERFPTVSAFVRAIDDGVGAPASAPVAAPGTPLPAAGIVVAATSIVSAPVPSSTPAAAPVRTSRRRRWIVAGAFVALVLVAGLAIRGRGPASGGLPHGPAVASISFNDATAITSRTASDPSASVEVANGALHLRTTKQGDNPTASLAQSHPREYVAEIDVRLDGPAQLRVQLYPAPSGQAAAFHALMIDASGQSGRLVLFDPDARPIRAGETVLKAFDLPRGSHGRNATIAIGYWNGSYKIAVDGTQLAEVDDQRTRAGPLTLALSGTSAQPASATITAVRYFAAP